MMHLTKFKKLNFDSGGNGMVLHTLMMMTGAPAKQAALGVTGMKVLGSQPRMALGWSA